VESYVVGAVFSSLFSTLINLNVQADSILSHRIQQLQFLSAADLGVRAPFQAANLQLAVQELKKLNINLYASSGNTTNSGVGSQLVHDSLSKYPYVTPFEQLLCLQKVVQLIYDAVAQCAISPTARGSSKVKSPRTATSSPPTAGMVFLRASTPIHTSSLLEPITTDDLIPLLVYVIIRSQVEHLRTNLDFIHHFIFIDINNTELGYVGNMPACQQHLIVALRFTLVTFEASVAYLESDQIANDAKVDVHNLNGMPSSVLPSAFKIGIVCSAHSRNKISCTLNNRSLCPSRSNNQYCATNNTGTGVFSYCCTATYVGKFWPQ
jgi:hypothetical protein